VILGCSIYHYATLGAKAAIGSIENENFLTVTFTDADIIYAMIPPFDQSDKTLI